MLQLDPDRPPEVTAATRGEALLPRAPLDERGHGRTAVHVTAGAVLALQRSHGNAYVQRLLASSQRVQRQGGPTQLQPPTLGGSVGWRPPAPTLGQYQLHLDPEIEAQIRAIEAMRQVVAPAPVTAALGQLSLPAVPLHLLPPSGRELSAPFPAAGPPSPALDPGPRPGTELQGPRPGEGGDIWRAAMSDAIIGPAVTRLGDLAAERARMDWASLRTGGQVAVVTTSVVLAGGALAGILTNPSGRDWALRALNDRIIPVPPVPGLSAQFNLGGDHVILGLHLDLGPHLPARLGFGRGVSPSPLGSPPNPYEPPPGQPFQ
jgi:hypothetical protein